MSVLYKYRLCHFILFTLIMSSAAETLSQNTAVDSLKQLLKIAKQDTTRMALLFELVENIDDDNVWPQYNEQALTLAENIAISNNQVLKLKGKKGIADALNNIGYIYNNKGDFSMALNYYGRSLKIREEIGDKKSIANSLNNIGFIYERKGNIIKALDYYTKNLKIQEEIGDKKGFATSLNNIGVIFNNQGNVPKALEYYDRSLKIREDIGDKTDIALSLNNIGAIYSNQNDFQKALVYYSKSLKIREEIGDKRGIATTINNIGAIYSKHGDIVNALDYYGRGLKIREEIGDKNGVANALNNIGVIYYHQNNLTKALDYYAKSLKILKGIGDKKGLANSLNNIGSVYFKLAAISEPNTNKQKKYLVALSYCDSSLFLSKQLGFPEHIRNAEQIHSKIDSATGNYAGAYNHYKQYIIYRDSINNEQTRKASTKSQLKYEYEKKEAIIKEQQEKERVIAQEKNRFQQIIIWSVIFGLLLVIIFSGFVFRSLKTTRKQKIIIEEKQKEILDSIHYAKRIQISLLPTEKYIERSLKQLSKKQLN